MAEHDQKFETYTTWVNKASSWLTRRTRRGEFQRATCYDARGRVINDGEGFMRARDEGAFPVRWVWPGDNLFDRVRETMREEGLGS